MKPAFVKSASETMRGVQVGEEIIDIYPSMKLGFSYNTKFQPGTFEFPYDGEDAVTLNRLLELGMAEEVQCYKMYDVYLGKNFTMTSTALNRIIKEFEEHGFKVTKKAIKHQYECWKSDCKSGYRDEANGYHLFSPCHCNPFAIRATTLSDLCKDWQKTYWA